MIKATTNGEHLAEGGDRVYRQVRILIGKAEKGRSTRTKTKTQAHGYKTEQVTDPGTRGNRDNTLLTMSEHCHEEII